MYKLCVYVPEQALEPLKQALFAAGAGRIGNYDQCSWQTLGEGQFRALPGSSPFIGEQGEIERLSEYRLEMVCSDDLVDAVILALRAAHPYEEPAFDLWRLEQR
ncbi:MAG: YqfO family protein [Halieaceae bacterium]